MPIFEDQKAIFVHIPKTGGTTVLRMFGLDTSDRKDIFYHIDEETEYDHATAQMIKAAKPEWWEKSYKFTLVRNPYDRLVSEFCWKKKDKDIRSVDVKDMNFGDFVHVLYNRFDKVQNQIQKEKSHLMPQSQFVLDDVEVFKYERINECFDFLVRQFGLPILEKHYNKTEHDPYESYYDPSLKSKVYDMYYTDFKLFGYDK